MNNKTRNSNNNVPKRMHSYFFKWNISTRCHWQSYAYSVKNTIFSNSASAPCIHVLISSRHGQSYLHKVNVIFHGDITFLMYILVAIESSLLMMMTFIISKKIATNIYISLLGKKMKEHKTADDLIQMLCQLTSCTCFSWFVWIQEISLCPLLSLSHYYLCMGSDWY